MVKPHSEAAKTSIKGSLKDALAGAAAGALAKTAVAPIERVKLLLQLQGSISNSPTNISGSAINVARTVYREEGFLAFWRGKYYNVTNTTKDCHILHFAN